jgi:glucose 1-dehydrogenase
MEIDMKAELLKDQVAIVTGASSGIGRAIAITFAEEGARVVNASLDTKHRENLEPTHQVIKDQGGDAIFVATDVSKKKDMQNLFSQTVEKYGRVDIMVNNAGIVRLGPVADATLEDWQAVMAVDLGGVFLGCKFAAVQMMKQGGDGVIINIASEDGYVYPVPGAVAYCAAKAGVIILTRQMALDYGREGIRINAICPGGTDTPATRHDTIGNIEAIVQAATPLGRIGKPEEIAYAALFLASKGASYVTGHNMNVDGGWACL